MLQHTFSKSDSWKEYNNPFRGYNYFPICLTMYPNVDATQFRTEATKKMPYMLDYTMVQMRKVNREKGYSI